MTEQELLETLNNQPEHIEFSVTMATIDAHYDFTPCAFDNGGQQNQAGENSGSCKILFFAKQHELTPEKTLHLFGDYYRKDVLDHPDGNDHQNIRQFMEHGWQGVHFSAQALVPK